MSNEFITVQVRMKLRPDPEAGRPDYYDDNPPEQEAYKAVREALDRAVADGCSDYYIDSLQVQGPKGEWGEVMHQFANPEVK